MTKISKPSPQKKSSFINIYYDGDCPSCVRDRQFYERLSGDDSNIHWCDITGKDEELINKGISPSKALSELHIEHSNKGILSEMDAYIVLMERVTWLKPFAWLLSIEPIKHCVSKIYHWQVQRRLKRQGKL